MVVITGSKSETPKLLSVVSKRYLDLSKYYKNDEIQAIQSWMKKQPHLPTISDDQVLVFLHASYYRIEKAKEIIDTYYTLRTRAPEVFSNRNPKKILFPAFKMAYFVSMPEEATSYNGNNVIILKFIDPDPAKADFVRDVKTAIASTDILVAKYPLTEGLEIIMDMEGLTLGHLAKIDFSALRVFMTYYQDALPARLKAVHVINTFSLVNQIMALLKPFMKGELLSKIYFYGPNEFNQLTSKYIPLESLPSDFGGTLSSLNKYQDLSMTDMEVATEWIEEQEQYKVNESKRIGQKRCDLNGCDGSFKKLEID